MLPSDRSTNSHGVQSSMMLVVGTEDQANAGNYPAGQSVDPIPENNHDGTGCRNSSNVRHSQYHKFRSKEYYYAQLWSPHLRLA